MTQLTGQERATYVQNMFTQIAKRYDLMNRLMTGFQDVRWRKQVIRLARLTNNASLLDLGTGTGDLAREALTQFPQAKVIAADDHIAGFGLLDKIRIQIFHTVLSQHGRIISVEIPCRDDLVGIDVRSIKQENSAAK